MAPSSTILLGVIYCPKFGQYPSSLPLIPTIAMPNSHSFYFLNMSQISLLLPTLLPLTSILTLTYFKSLTSVKLHHLGCDNSLLLIYFCMPSSVHLPCSTQGIFFLQVLILPQHGSGEALTLFCKNSTILSHICVCHLFPLGCKIVEMRSWILHIFLLRIFGIKNTKGKKKIEQFNK